MGVAEGIILQKDIRNISKLKDYLSDNFLSNPTVNKLAKDFKQKDPSEEQVQEHIKS